MITLPLYIYIFVELIFVAWGDYKTRKISNYWSILNIIVFIILLISMPAVYTLDFNIFLYSFSFLLVGFALFIFKVMGGGDAKFLATFILLVPISLQSILFTSLLIATIIVASIFLFKNIVTNFSFLLGSLKAYDFVAVKNCFGTKFAFAPVILMSWIILGWKIRKFIF